MVSQQVRHTNWPRVPCFPSRGPRNRGNAVLQEAADSCRNPGGEEDAPWCYTRNRTVRWERCAVPRCAAAPPDGVTPEAPPGGDDELRAELAAPRRVFSMETIIVVVTVALLSLVLLVVTATLCARMWRHRKRRLRYEVSPQTDLDAADLDAADLEIDLGRIPHNARYHRATLTPLNPKLERLEYPRNDIVYIRDVGRGAFGRVFQARAPRVGRRDGGGGDDDATVVAVKMLRDDATEEMQRDFEREASLMVEFAHANIVRLLGICAVGRPMCLLFEFMSRGDLNEFLRNCSPERYACARRRTTFSDPRTALSDPRTSFSEPRTGFSERRRTTFSDCSPERRRTLSGSLASLLGDLDPAPGGGATRLTHEDQLRVALQIADGMTYISEAGFVHRDLATRNCLVGDNLEVKIADFGLTRDLALQHEDYYKGSEHDAIPIRWMPCEAILYNKYVCVWRGGGVRESRGAG